MSPTRAMAGLSTSDIDGLRDAMGTGRRPKVVFTPAAGQIAGQIGQVVELGDPKASDEWITVRFGKDELTFSPAEVAIPAKQPRQSRKREPQPAAPPPPPLAPPLTKEEFVASNGHAGASRGGTTAEHPTGNGAAGGRDADAGAGNAGSAKSGKSGSARKGRTKVPAELSVTLSWHDGQWSVQAQRGSRTVVRATPVPAHGAVKMVSLLESPAVQTAVEEIVEATRVAAEEHADQLRRELAEVEALLTELRPE